MRKVNFFTNTLLSLAVAAITFNFTPDAFALVGGPWDNNAHSNTGTQGTYVASLRGTNTIGRVFFSTSDTAESYGAVSIFREGVYYRGGAQGDVDFHDSKVFCTFGAVDITSISEGEVLTTDSGGGFFSFSFGTVTEGNALSVFNSPDQYSVSGGFDVKIKKKHPVPRFKGSGQAFFTRVIDANATLLGVDDGTFSAYSGTQTKTTSTTYNPSPKDVNGDGVISTSTPYDINGDGVVGTGSEPNVDETSVTTTGGLVSTETGTVDVNGNGVIEPITSYFPGSNYPIDGAPFDRDGDGTINNFVEQTYDDEGNVTSTLFGTESNIDETDVTIPTSQSTVSQPKDVNSDGIIETSAQYDRNQDGVYDNTVETIDETNVLSDDNATTTTTVDSANIEPNLYSPQLETTEVTLRVEGYRSSTQAANILSSVSAINEPIYYTPIEVVPDNVTLINSGNDGGN